MPQLEQLAALAELYKASQIHSHAFSAHRVSHHGVFTIRNDARVFLCVAEGLHELLNFLGRLPGYRTDASLPLPVKS
jgi:hypothetical protein